MIINLLKCGGKSITNYELGIKKEVDVFVIMSYDVHRKRVNKVHKIAKKYLNWIQNSVFEGELTMAQLKKLKLQLDDVIKHNYDSIVFYIYPNPNYISKKFIGVDKSWLTTNVL